MRDNRINEYQRGDMYWADLGRGDGSEQGGTRPVVIIQNDIGNRYSPTVVVATMTSKKSKKPIPTHVEINKDRYDNLVSDSVVLTEQVRTIDKSRLLSKIEKVKDDDMESIERALLVSLGFITRFKLNSMNNHSNTRELQYA